MADFATLRSRLGRRQGHDGNAARLGDFVNDAVQFIWSWRSDWSFARRTTQIRTLTPEEGTGASVTNGSREVTGVTVGTFTRRGARISLPDGNVYDIASADGTSVWLSVPYLGASLVKDAAWKIYYDTYALPPDCSEVESIVLTGNGWEYPVRQDSILPQHMKVLTTRDFESYSSLYALESAGQIPAPRTAPTPVDGGAGSMGAGTYTYAYAFYNSASGEESPLSPSASITQIASKQVSLSFASPVETRPDYQIRIYRTLADGTQLYYLGDYAAGAVIDNVTDNRLGEVSGATYIWVGENPGAGQTQRIRLWAPPDDDYLIHMSYFAAVREMVKDTDVPAIPARFHQLVLDYAQALYMREQEQHAAAGALEGRVAAKLDKMSEQQDTDPSTVIQVGRGFPDPYASRLLEDGTIPRFVG